MSKVNYYTRQKIVAQALQEIAFARNYKQGKIKNWKLNEDLYYGRKNHSEYTMSNVDLGEMQGHVHTIMSKVDEAMVFKFTKRKKAQLQRVNRLNALRIYDQDRGFWDMKDIAGKKQSVIYGRTIFSYFADSVDGVYGSHLDGVDVYDFLIDPSAGGLFIEKAQYLGNYGVVLSRQEIEAGAKDGTYLKTEAMRLIEGGSNALEQPQEEINKYNRTRDTNVWQVDKEMSGTDKFKFWHWGTTYAGERYYLLLTERGATAIELCPLREKFKSGLWWYWSYAAFPDLTEFWTPSFCDYVREIIMAKAVSINQAIDNSEKINKPQRKVQVGAIENMAELKYRREGLIKVKKDFDIDKAYQVVATPAIETPLKVFQVLDSIQNRSSGVTAGDSGDAKNDAGAKATIYKGNQMNSADKYGYFNKSYAFGYKQFARLYEAGVDEHLIRKVAVEILGPDGVQIEEVSRRDIFRKNDKFGITTQSSNAELALAEEEKRLKLGFLQANDKDPNSVQNKKKSYELQAEIAGFDDESIRELMDTSEFGDEEMMAMAENDIEQILDGKNIPPNLAANSAYKQRFVDYLSKNIENLQTEEWARLTDYTNQLQPIIIRNTVKMANDLLAKQELKQLMTTPPPEDAANTIVPPGGALPVDSAPLNGGQ